MFRHFFFKQGALNVPRIPRFSSFFNFQFSKQASQQHWYLQCFDKTNIKKTRCFETSFHKISAPPFKKRSFFALFLPLFIWAQEAPPELKLTCVSASGRHALLHLRCGRIYFSNLDPEMQLHGKAEANQFSGVFLLLISWVWRGG